MHQIRQNWCMILHVKYSWLARLVHSEETDKVDITAVAIEFVWEILTISLFLEICVVSLFILWSFLHQGYDEQPVLSQNSINALECQSYNSRVLAGILALQPMEIPKTRLYIIVVLVITAYNPHHAEQSLHMSSFALNICLLRALKVTVFGH